jgi:hypothetical protein
VQDDAGEWGKGGTDAHKRSSTVSVSAGALVPHVAGQSPSLAEHELLEHHSQPCIKTFPNSTERYFSGEGQGTLAKEKDNLANNFITE